MIDNIFAPEQGQKQPQEIKLGTVTSVSSGRVKVLFDGEATAGDKLYRRLVSYSSPATNDRVLLVRVGGTYVVAGKIA